MPNLRMVQLRIEGASVSYETGDNLSIWPRNPVEKVEAGCQGGRVCLIRVFLLGYLAPQRTLPKILFPLDPIDQMLQWQEFCTAMGFDPTQNLRVRSQEGVAMHGGDAWRQVLPNLVLLKCELQQSNKSVKESRERSVNTRFQCDAILAVFWLAFH